MLKERIPLELNEQDAAQLRRLAEEAGVTRTEMIRQLIRGDRRVFAPPPKFEALPGETAADIRTRLESVSAFEADGPFALTVEPEALRETGIKAARELDNLRRALDATFCEHGAAKGLCKHRGCK